MMTVDQCLKLAFAALLRGDTAERDKWCRLAQNIHSGQMRQLNNEPLVVGELIAATVETVEDDDGA